MKALKFILLLFCTIQFCAAQSNSINYKALIKDTNGNVVANQTVTVQFTILENTTAVYTETHTPTTNANGLVNLNIGTGSSSDDFNDINWKTYNHNLNVQVNIGAGLVDLGTTAFKSVPYAAYAGNFSGLEKIDEGSGGSGWRLVGSNPATYGDIGWDAVDLSRSNEASSTYGATGNGSLALGTKTTASGDLSTALGHLSTASGLIATAIGNNTTASGLYATALGNGTIASGASSTSFGQVTNASGTYATAMGRDTEATGNYSSVMGRDTKAEASYSTAIGRYNIAGGNLSGWIGTDPLFEIGNGENSTNLSNALTVLKNGTITAPSFDISEITDDKALITKEYADINLISSGLEALDEGNGLGWRLKGQNPLNYNNIGENAIDLSHSLTEFPPRGASGNRAIAFGTNTIASGNYSTALGLGSEASGNTSIAMGSSTTASGQYATAIGHLADASGNSSIATGYNTEALGNYSTAMNYNTEASGTGSTAMGRYTIASGNYSTAMGIQTKADALGVTAMGRFNAGGGNANSWQSVDPLFEIGNGTTDTNRSNALTVLKNGKVGLGTHQPDAFLEIKANNNTNEPTVRLVHEGATGARINFTNTSVTNGNYWTLYGEPNDVDANSTFNIYHPNKGNILRVRGDGEVGFNGIPNTDFHVYHTNDAANSGLKLQNTNSNNEWWRMFTSNTNGNLYLYSTTGGSAPRGNFNKITGVYSSASDRRLKTNFKPISFSWQNFMNLKTLSYRYKTQKNDKRSLGLIAQDVKRIYPELVTYNSDNDVYHLNYSGFGVVAIKAIQELKNEVDALKSENAALKQKLNKLEKLEARLSALEAASNSGEIILTDKK